MKEKIYTIPMNEAYDTDCECPLCLLENKLEHDAVNFALGDAMMQPDHRELSNKVGYCSKHFSLMMQRKNKLSLALVLETHLQEIRTHLEKYAQRAPTLSKPTLRRNPAQELTDELCAFLDEVNNSCVVCQKIDSTMEHYLDVLFYMWDNDEKFHEKFVKSKGVCLPHLKRLLKAMPKYLPKQRQNEFLAELLSKEMSELARIQEDVLKFTLKFDYRNQDMPWGTAQDAPIRAVEKIAGSITPLTDDE